MSGLRPRTCGGVGGSPAPYTTSASPIGGAAGGAHRDGAANGCGVNSAAVMYRGGFRMPTKAQGSLEGLRETANTHAGSAALRGRRSRSAQMSGRPQGPEPQLMI